LIFDFEYLSKDISVSAISALGKRGFTVTNSQNQTKSPYHRQNPQKYPIHKRDPCLKALTIKNMDNDVIIW